MMWYTIRYGMVWYGMVWYVVVWYGMVLYRLNGNGTAWYGMVCGTIWNCMLQYGTVWCGMVWYVTVQYGRFFLQFRKILLKFRRYRKSFDLCLKNNLKKQMITKSNKKLFYLLDMFI